MIRADPRLAGSVSLPARLDERPRQRVCDDGSHPSTTQAGLRAGASR